VRLAACPVTATARGAHAGSVGQSPRLGTTTTRSATGATPTRVGTTTTSRDPNPTWLGITIGRATRRLGAATTNPTPGAGRRCPVLPSPPSLSVLRWHSPGPARGRCSVVPTTAPIQPATRRPPRPTSCPRWPGPSQARRRRPRPRRVSREVWAQHPGQQPDRPVPDPQVDVGVAEAAIAGLIQGGLVVVGKPGQASHSQVVVVLLNGVSHSPLDQPLHARAHVGRWGRRRDDMPGTPAGGADRWPPGPLDAIGHLLPQAGVADPL
jgi:hypothetical protein